MSALPKVGGDMSPPSPHKLDPCNILTNEYNCFYKLFNVRGLETKENYFRGRGREKVRNHWCRV